MGRPEDCSRNVLEIVALLFSVGLVGIRKSAGTGVVGIAAVAQLELVLTRSI